MKFDKNKTYLLSLFVTATSLIISLFTILFDENKFNTDNTLLMLLLSVVAACILLTYVTIIFRRTNPKKFIYISYSGTDRDIAKLVKATLETEFEKRSKYRFEILTGDTIPFGSDFKKTVFEYLEKANIVIVIVSENYITSKYCNDEFVELCGKKKKIIPIVLDSYKNLSQLPKDISNIKALSLIGCKTADENIQQVSMLAKELIKLRND